MLQRAREAINARPETALMVAERELPAVERTLVRENRPREDFSSFLRGMRSYRAKADRRHEGRRSGLPVKICGQDLRLALVT
jgi:hypothetical protein